MPQGKSKQNKWVNGAGMLLVNLPATMVYQLALWVQLLQTNISLSGVALKISIEHLEPF